MENNWKEAIALPAGTILRSGKYKALYTISVEAPRFGGSSIFYRLTREGSSLPYGLKECCPSELEGRLRRIGGTLAGTDEEAQYILENARRHMLAEAEISQRVAALSSRAIPVLEAPEELFIQLKQASAYCSESSDVIFDEPSPAGSMLIMRQMSAAGMFLPEILNECSLEPAEGYPMRTGGQPSLYTAARLLAEALRALELVHRAGYVYGDLQPANIFYGDARPEAGEPGFGMLLDFGCARCMTDENKTAPVTDCMVFTTPGFAAPELLLENDGTLCLSPAADVYSAGRLLLYLLRGRTYCETGWDGRLRDRLIEGETARITRILPAEAERLGCSSESMRLLQQLLDRSLARAAEDRYPDAAAMLEDAQKLLRLTQPAKNNLALSFSTLGEGEFLGRAQQLREIDRALRSGRKPVVISGFAGMGKTELAIEYARGYRRGAAFFVRCRDTVYETVTGPVADAFTEYSKTDVRGRRKSDEEIYREVMKLLGERGENDLLIIDNMDGGRSGYMGLAAEQAFRDLCALPLRLLVTTRSQVEGAVEADALPRPLLRSILHRYERKSAPISDETADRLIDAVESHTLTVELIGRTLKNTIPRITPELMLKKLTEGRLDDERLAAVSSSKDRLSNTDRIQGHLTRLFQLANLPDDEKRLLGYMLPASGLGLPAEELANTEAFDQDALLRLVDRGWIRRSDDDTLSMHELVRNTALREISISSSDMFAFDTALLARIIANYGRSDIYFDQIIGYVENTCRLSSREVQALTGAIAILMLSLRSEYEKLEIFTDEIFKRMESEMGTPEQRRLSEEAELREWEKMGWVPRSTALMLSMRRYDLARIGNTFLMIADTLQNTGCDFGQKLRRRAEETFPEMQEVKTYGSKTKEIKEIYDAYDIYFPSDISNELSVSAEQNKRLASISKLLEKKEYKKAVMQYEKDRAWYEENGLDTSLIDYMIYDVYNELGQQERALEILKNACSGMSRWDRATEEYFQALVSLAEYYGRNTEYDINERTKNLKLACDVFMQLPDDIQLKYLNIFTDEIFDEFNEISGKAAKEPAEPDIWYELRPLLAERLEELFGEDDWFELDEDEEF